MVRRDWTAAIARHEGKPCRVCLRWPRHLAHILPREYDRRRGRMQGTIRVDALAVVPLCESCHTAYDARELDLTPHLTQEELEHAFLQVGEATALRYIKTRETGSVANLSPGRGATSD